MRIVLERSLCPVDRNGRKANPAALQVSLTTFCATLSSRRRTYFAWRRCSPSVHSKKSNCATTSGLSQRHSLIFLAVSPTPHRPALASGRFTNGHSSISKPRSLPKTSRLGPAQTRSECWRNTEVRRHDRTRSAMSPSPRFPAGIRLSRTPGPG